MHCGEILCHCRDAVGLLRLPGEVRQLVRVILQIEELRDIDLRALAGIRRYTIVTTANVQAARRGDDPTGAGANEGAACLDLPASVRFIDERAVYAAGYRYEDLVRAVDVVATKPGYRIIAECIANGAAVLYTSRGHFPEYDVIVEDMPKYLRTSFISNEELFGGKWEPYLDKLLAQARPRKYKKPETNGADVAAELLLKALDKPPKKPRGRPRAKF